MFLVLLACTATVDDRPHTADPDTADTSATPDTGDTADTALSERLPAALLLDGLGTLVDAVEPAEGVVYASAAGAGVYRWDGEATLVLAHDNPGTLSPGGEGGAYVSDGTNIFDVAAGTAITGPESYAPGALDLFPTDQGDRLSFAGTDPATRAVAIYTVKASGGTVATVGEGYASPLLWIFRPEGETCWATDVDGTLWLVADGEDVAYAVASGLPTGGLAGNVGGSTLYVGGDRSVLAYDVATGDLTEYPLDIDDSGIVSAHRSYDATGLVVTTATAVYSWTWPAP